jgi:hypothetical protein
MEGRTTLASHEMSYPHRQGRPLAAVARTSFERPGGVSNDLDGWRRSNAQRIELRDKPKT